ncbi:hypothetical protein FRC02_000001 [Tulasnella sp. 418]|nr:hypothetical protein FRC02_000001 [Tulasnella sp. 418]
MSAPSILNQDATVPMTLSLGSEAPSLAVEVLPYGFTIHKILVNDGDKTHDIVIGPNDPEDHRTHREFMNTVVGRYSNRVPVGTIELEKDGIKSQLTLEPTESTQVSLHGGPDGFDRRVFEVIDPVKNPESYSLFSLREKQAINKLTSSAVFKLTSPAGDQGFPGTLYVEILTGLEAGSGPTFENGIRHLGSLVLIYRAKIILGDSEEKVVTPVNLTQHWGFNLDASIPNGQSPTPDIKAHLLTIKSNNTLELQPNGLATGNLLPTTASPYEHAAKPIGKFFPPQGYDEYYLFERPITSVPPSRVPLSDLKELDTINQLLEHGEAQKDKAPVTLYSQRSGILLTFETNQPGVQFYTGNGLHGQVSKKILHGGSGKTDPEDGYQTGAGAFLEFHEPLAAWLHPYKTYGDTLLTSDELYNNYTRLNIFTQKSGN